MISSCMIHQFFLILTAKLCISIKSAELHLLWNFRKDEGGREVTRGTDDRSLRNTNELMLQHVDISFFYLCSPCLFLLLLLLPALCFSAGRRVSLLACHPVVTLRPVMWLEWEFTTKGLTPPENSLPPPRNSGRSPRMKLLTFSFHMWSDYVCGYKWWPAEQEGTLEIRQGMRCHSPGKRNGSEMSVNDWLIIIFNYYLLS